MMQGTPYVYQGDELGMKNVPFHDLSEFRDIESINAFHELTGAGKVAPDDMMRYLNLRGRDNARTPMQWMIPLRQDLPQEHRDQGRTGLRDRQCQE